MHMHNFRLSIIYEELEIANWFKNSTATTKIYITQQNIRQYIKFNLISHCVVHMYITFKVGSIQKCLSYSLFLFYLYMQFLCKVIQMHWSICVCSCKIVLNYNVLWCTLSQRFKQLHMCSWNHTNGGVLNQVVCNLLWWMGENLCKTLAQFCACR